MSDTAAALAAPLPPIELTPQDAPRHRGRNAMLSLGLSLAVIAVVLMTGNREEFHRLPGMIPTSPMFWLAFMGSYLSVPISEWMIFRRLWGIPLGGGLIALMRKKVYNELLLGYLGEAYFYTWARKRVALTAAPFGAVKDSAILSAMTGNAVTLLLLGVMLAVLGPHTLNIDAHVLTLSLGVILAVSVVAMVFRRKVFTLPRHELAVIAATHLGRIVATTLLNAVAWHLALPVVTLPVLLFLATLRLLVSRLPLVPNKDVLFAGVTAVVLGNDQDIGALMALMAALIMATHLLVGMAIALHDLVYGLEKQK